MPVHKSYKVRYELDDTAWWVATVVGVAGCHTQGRTLEQAERRIREALALFIPARAARCAELTAHIRLSTYAQHAVDAAAESREIAKVAAQNAQEAARGAARCLAEQGLSLRDVGQFLGVTRQRAHQLIVD